MSCDWCGGVGGGSLSSLLPWPRRTDSAEEAEAEGGDSGTARRGNQLSSPDAASLLRTRSDLRSATAAAAAFTEGEVDVLLRTCRLLDERRRDHVCKDDGGGGGNESAGTSFLHDLAECAALAEAEEWNRYYGASCLGISLAGEAGQGNDDSAPTEERIESLLERARRSAEAESKARRRLATLARLEKSVFPSSFVLALEGSLASRSKDGKDGNRGPEHYFMDAVSGWLGRSESDSVLDIVFDACRLDYSTNQTRTGGTEGVDLKLADDNCRRSPKDEAKARDLVEFCYRLAVASDVLDVSGASPRAHKIEGDNSESNDAGGPTINKVGSTEDMVLSLLDWAQEQRNAARTPPSSLAAPSERDTITRGEFRRWTFTRFPAFTSPVPAFVGRIVLPGLADAEGLEDSGVSVGTSGRALQSAVRGKPRNSRHPRVFPELFGHGGASSAFFGDNVSPSLFAFASMSPKKFVCQWHRLYSSDTDGLSFPVLEHSLCGYAGPTLLLISAITKDTTTRGTFGAYTSTSWKPSGSQFFGDDNCFLFQLEPRVLILHTKKNRGGKYMYFNSSKRADGRGCARGLGFGGTATKPRLFVSDSLDECHAGSNDSSFEAGELFVREAGRNNAPLHMDSLEVWGLGDNSTVEKAFGERNRLREVKQSNIDKARTVDKTQFLGDFHSGLIESKMFAHKKQIEDR